MKTKTKYVAEDGTEFNERKKAVEYERLLNDIKEYIEPLGKAPSGSGYYRQHAPKVVRDAWRKIVERVMPMFEYYYKEKTLPKDLADIHPSSFLGRLIDDSGISCLQGAQYRFASIDFTTGREYDQPYYVNHPPSDAKPE